jgi:hypothetical protein
MLVNIEAVVNNTAEKTKRPEMKLEKLKTYNTATKML